MGLKRASWELQQKGIMFPSSGARSIRMRNEFETMKKWLKALEARAAQGGKVRHPPIFPFNIVSLLTDVLHFPLTNPLNVAPGLEKPRQLHRLAVECDAARAGCRLILPLLPGQSGSP